MTPLKFINSAVFLYRWSVWMLFYVFCFQLPIYDEPEIPQFERLPEWETAFHRQVSRARKWTWSYLDSIQVLLPASVQGL